VNRKVLLVGTAIVVPLLIFLALSFGKDPRAIESPLVDTLAPGFALLDLDGQPVDLAQLRGQPVMINFWATWCRPCVVEHPVLQAIAQRYEGRAHFVGIVYQDDPELIRGFVARRGGWGRTLLDPDGETAIAYGVYGAPETFFIDSGGTVVRKVTGAMGADFLSGIIEGLL
jgi:cytochrome c biogenesis protein CcmG/thiol:disulfide interchange protein DsbE